MTTRFNITKSKPPNGALALVVSIVLIIIASSAPTFAHSGFDHVIGTVVRVANNVLTVKTAKGNVDVKLDDHTELTRNDRKAQLADLKPGARVVVEVPKGNKEMLAHSIKVGVSTQAADSHSQGSHK
jgi:hypothetical protein